MCLIVARVVFSSSSNVASATKFKINVLGDVSVMLLLLWYMEERVIFELDDVILLCVMYCDVLCVLVCGFCNFLF